MNDRIYIFDTTLRDGEQSPGASMNINEKVEVSGTSTWENAGLGLLTVRAQSHAMTVSSSIADCGLRIADSISSAVAWR